MVRFQAVWRVLCSSLWVSGLAETLDTLFPGDFHPLLWVPLALRSVFTRCWPGGALAHVAPVGCVLGRDLVLARPIALASAAERGFNRILQICHSWWLMRHGAAARRHSGLAYNAIYATEGRQILGNQRSFRL